MRTKRHLVLAGEVGFFIEGLRLLRGWLKHLTKLYKLCAIANIKVFFKQFEVHF